MMQAACDEVMPVPGCKQAVARASWTRNRRQTPAARAARHTGRTEGQSVDRVAFGRGVRGCKESVVADSAGSATAETPTGTPVLGDVKIEKTQVSSVEQQDEQTQPRQPQDLQQQQQQQQQQQRQQQGKTLATPSAEHHPTGRMTHAMHMAQHRLTERFAYTAAEMVLEKVAHSAGSTSWETTAASAHLSQLLAWARVFLPLLGAFLIVHVARQDAQRCSEGVKRQCFVACIASGIAVVASLLDMAMHLAVSAGKFGHWDHDVLDMVERASVGLAAVSMIAAFVGEMTVLRDTTKLKHD